MRRVDPERIYRAKRAGFVARFEDWIGHQRAEALVEALTNPRTKNAWVVGQCSRNYHARTMIRSRTPNTTLDLTGG